MSPLTEQLNGTTTTDAAALVMHTKVTAVALLCGRAMSPCPVQCVQIKHVYATQLQKLGESSTLGML